MSTWTSALESCDGRVLMAFDCVASDDPVEVCSVVAATWHEGHLLVAILKSNGILRVVDAATLRYRNKT